MTPAKKVQEAQKNLDAARLAMLEAHEAWKVKCVKYTKAMSALLKAEAEAKAAKKKGKRK